MAVEWNPSTDETFKKRHDETWRQAAKEVYSERTIRMNENFKEGDWVIYRTVDVESCNYSYVICQLEKAIDDWPSPDLKPKVISSPTEVLALHKIKDDYCKNNSESQEIERLKAVNEEMVDVLRDVLRDSCGTSDDIGRLLKKYSD